MREKKKTTLDLVFVLLGISSLVIHLQDDLLQLFFSASHQLGGDLSVSVGKIDICKITF